jgi:hypothetical protein
MALSGPPAKIGKSPIAGKGSKDKDAGPVEPKLAPSRNAPPSGTKAGKNVMPARGPDKKGGSHVNKKGVAKKKGGRGGGGRRDDMEVDDEGPKEMKEFSLDTVIQHRINPCCDL